MRPKLSERSAADCAGIAYALLNSMELLGRLGIVFGISLILTLLLLVLYQDDGARAQTVPAITQASTAPADGAP